MSMNDWMIKSVVYDIRVYWFNDVTVLVYQWLNPWMKNKDLLCFSTSGFTRPYSSTEVEIIERCMIRLFVRPLFPLLIIRRNVCLPIIVFVYSYICSGTTFYSRNSFICKEQIEELDRLFLTFYQKRCLTDNSIGPQIKLFLCIIIGFRSFWIRW